MLIGISGKIGSGKDTLAHLLTKRLPNIELKSFAYKVKYITHFMTGISLEQQFSQEGKNIYMPEWGMTVGEFQQKLGTNGMRVGVHQEAWIISLFLDFKDTSNWIISDVRFPNEAKAIKDRRGFLIRIEGDPAGVRARSLRDLSHPSETSLDTYNSWDYRFVNEPGIEKIDFHAQKVVGLLK